MPVYHVKSQQSYRGCSLGRLMLRCWGSQIVVLVFEGRWITMTSHTQTFHCLLCFTAEILKEIGHSMWVSQWRLIMDLVTKWLDESGPLNRLACKPEKLKGWQALLPLCSEQSYTRVCQWAIEICCKDSLLTIYQPVNECIYRFSHRVYLSWSMQRVWFNLTWLGSCCSPVAWGP